MEKINKELSRGKQERFAQAGDIVWVEYQDSVGSVRYKTFTGVCVSCTRKGVLRLRSRLGGVWVEYGFHLESRNIREVKLVQAKPKKGGRVKRYEIGEKL